MLASVGVKAWSGKEDTTLLSMADCRVKQANVSTAHQIWNKTPDSRVSKGERTHRGSKDPSTKKKVDEPYHFRKRDFRLKNTTASRSYHDIRCI